MIILKDSSLMRVRFLTSQTMTLLFFSCFLAVNVAHSQINPFGGGSGVRMPPSQPAASPGGAGATNPFPNLGNGATTLFVGTQIECQLGANSDITTVGIVQPGGLIPSSCKAVGGQASLTYFKKSGTYQACPIPGHGPCYTACQVSDPNAFLSWLKSVAPLTAAEISGVALQVLDSVYNGQCNNF